MSPAKALHAPFGGRRPSRADDGAILTVTAPTGDVGKLRGLGFIGVMTRGMHHQAHHLAIAKGSAPHR